MAHEGFESGRKPVIGGESSPQEGDALLRYADLQGRAFNALMSKEERKDFSQDLIDLVKLLNKGTGMNSAFCEEMLNQVHRIEEGYLRLQRAVEAVNQLERESRMGILSQSLYDTAVRNVQSALNCGVPARVLEPLESKVRDYLFRVQKSQSR